MAPPFRLGIDFCDFSAAEAFVPVAEVRLDATGFVP
jgi:hypothetical protein